MYGNLTWKGCVYLIHGFACSDRISYYTIVLYNILVTSCGHPGFISHGILIGSSYNYKDAVKYTCHTGYEQDSGDFERICQSNGSWSGSEPSYTGMQNQ